MADFMGCKTLVDRIKQFLKQCVADSPDVPPEPHDGPPASMLASMHVSGIGAVSWRAHHTPDLRDCHLEWVRFPNFGCWGRLTALLLISRPAARFCAAQSASNHQNQAGNRYYDLVSTSFMFATASQVGSESQGAGSCPEHAILQGGGLFQTTEPHRCFARHSGI